MKKTALIAIAVSGLFMTTACRQRVHDSVGTADSLNKSKDTNTAARHSAVVMEVNKDDAKFVVDAANGGMAEVAFGKAAVAKATNPRVKQFAQMMIDDHSKANKELATVATSRNVTIPSVIGTDEQKKLDDLNKKSGADFDKAYVNAMVDDHKQDVKEFQDAGKKVKDEKIKAFIDKTLPVLQMHLDSITKIQSSMK